MTIPQILSFVGWPMFAIGVITFAVHSVNVFIPDIDFLFSSGHMPFAGYAITTPLIVLGLLTGLAGHFSEQIHERWLEKDHPDYEP